MYEFYHYLPVEDSIIQWGLYLTGVGRGIIPSEDHYPPTGHPKLYSFNYQRGRILPEFQFILITEGHGIFESKQTGPIPILPNTLIILFPDVWHRYQPDKRTGWKERWISINGTIAHHLMNQGYLNPNYAVKHLSEKEQLISTFDHLLNRIHQNPTENTVVTSLNAMVLLNQIIEVTGTSKKVVNEQYHKNTASIPDPLVVSVLDFIWTQSHRPITVNSILRRVPASRRTLERRFRKAHGHSIHEEIIQCRLSRAKRLLLETRTPIKTVAYMSGFNCIERMRRAFEKILGQSPSEFRKQHSFTVIP